MTAIPKYKIAGNVIDSLEVVCEQPQSGLNYGNIPGLFCPQRFNCFFAENRLTNAKKSGIMQCEDMSHGLNLTESRFTG